MKKFRKLLCLALALCALLSFALVASAHGVEEEAAASAPRSCNHIFAETGVYLGGNHSASNPANHYNIWQLKCSKCGVTSSLTRWSGCTSSHCVYPYSVLLPY